MRKQIQMKKDLYSIYGLILSFSIYSIIMIPTFTEYLFLLEENQFNGSAYDVILITEAATRMG